MNPRKIFVLLLLAFIGGGVLVSWLGLSLPWGQQLVATKKASMSAPASLASPLPQTLAPVDAGRAEALLLVIAARRAILAGRPLGDSGTRLEMLFGPSQPDALKAVEAAAQQQMTTATLLTELDAIAPELATEQRSDVEKLRHEAATLFVLRHGPSPRAPAEVRIARVRELLVSGNIENAVRLVRAMPGAVAAGTWLAKADRLAAASRALDTLEAAALAYSPASGLPVQ